MGGDNGNNTIRAPCKLQVWPMPQWSFHTFWPCRLSLCAQNVLLCMCKHVPLCFRSRACLGACAHTCGETLSLSFLQMSRCQTHPPFTLSVNCALCAPVEVQQEVSTDWLFSTQTHLQWCENSFHTYKYFGMQVCLRDSLLILPCDYRRIEALTLEVLCSFNILLHADLKTSAYVSSVTSRVYIKKWPWLNGMLKTHSEGWVSEKGQT